jgi:tetratricopeptide (TPR) repeat protein
MPFFDIAKHIYKKDEGNNLMGLALLHGTKGTFYRNSDKPALAVQQFDEEIRFIEEAIRCNKIESHTIKLARAYKHISDATQQLGNFKGAEGWHQKNLALLLKYHLEDPRDVSLAYINEGSALQRINRLVEATTKME